MNHVLQYIVDKFALCTNTKVRNVARNEIPGVGGGRGFGMGHVLGAVESPVMGKE